MRLAKVIGTVVATRKEESLIGFKLLVIEEIDPRTEQPRENCLVAVDTLGAGEGDIVLWVQGGAARVISEEHRKAPLDVAIVGIIDAVDIADE
ncbi:MAG: EutN/CcmL family microcompartment protein [Chloroflexi bacterium]|nr:EutN/CcmL family microcompartment protein [Chloroflexota bacterium]MBP7044252.1 EutN/CcmL family microcompartment protein [Chloroflexota bacterium]